MSKILIGYGFQEFINSPESYYLHIKRDNKTGLETLCADRRGFFTWIKAHIFRSAYKLRSIADKMRSAENLVDFSPTFISRLNQRIKKYNSLHTDQISELFEKSVRKTPIKKTETAQFWEALTGNNDLYTYLQRVVINPGEERLKAKAIVNRYAKFLEGHGQVLSQFSRDGFELEVIKQLVIKSKKGGKYSLTDALHLHTFITCSDGSCGLHALLCDDGTYGIQTEQNEARKCKAQDARHDFCSWLRSLGVVNHWPDAIQEQLLNYLVNFDEERETASEFMRHHHALIEPYYTRYSASVSSNAEQDYIKSEFISDSTIIDAYLECLEDVNVYLTQPELLEMAKYFQKPLALYQPGWGNERSRVRVKLYDRTGREEDLQIANDEEKQANLNRIVSQGDYIAVFYNGTDHFERALLLNKEIKTPSSP